MGTNQCRRTVGRMMVRHIVRVAKSRARGEKPVELVCLSSPSTEISFWEACGFVISPDVKLSCASNVFEGQIYMEYRLGRRVRSVSKSKIQENGARVRRTSRQQAAQMTKETRATRW